jgi:hypothetical protein
MDTERAISIVAELCAATERYEQQRGPYGLPSPARDKAKADADRLIGPCERIARAVDPRLAVDLVDKYRRDPGWAASVCRQIIGRLESDADIDALGTEARGGRVPPVGVECGRRSLVRWPLSGGRPSGGYGAF